MRSLFTQKRTVINAAPRCTGSLRKSWFGQWLLLAIVTIAVTGVPAYAVNRKVWITAPASAISGDPVSISVAASTDAGGGEQIGFFHAEYSTDGGANWTPISFKASDGTSATHSVKFTAGAAGSKVIVRVRIAFRGGKAGDVDFTGKPIEWETSWSKWERPPAKFSQITIVAP
jgi:hypothetical protein